MNFFNLGINDASFYLNALFNGDIVSLGTNSAPRYYTIAKMKTLKGGQGSPQDLMEIPVL